MQLARARTLRTVAAARARAGARAEHLWLPCFYTSSPRCSSLSPMRSRSAFAANSLAAFRSSWSAYVQRFVPPCASLSFSLGHAPTSHTLSRLFLQAAKSSDLPLIDKNKFLVPGDLTGRRAAACAPHRCHFLPLSLHRRNRMRSRHTYAALRRCPSQSRSLCLWCGNGKRSRAGCACRRRHQLACVAPPACAHPIACCARRRHPFHPGSRWRPSRRCSSSAAARCRRRARCCASWRAPTPMPTASSTSCTRRRTPLAAATASQSEAFKLAAAAAAAATAAAAAAAAAA